MKQRHYLFLFLISFLLTGCGHELKGRVFLDQNNNNKHEQDEPALANMGFALTRNDAEVKKGKTDKSGRFKLDVDDKDGTYCITVVEADLLSLDVTRVALFKKSPLHSPFLKGEKWKFHFLNQAHAQVGIPREVNCDNGDDDDADGKKDCDDSDCANDAKCVDNNPPVEDPVDDKGDDESEKDDKKNEDGVSSTESGKACGTLSGSALELNIPIGVDYSAQLSNFDATQEREKRLSHITLDLHYPESCRVKNIDFPSFIEPVDAELKEKTFNPDSHEISLETVIAILQVRNACRRSNFETAIHDTIRTCPLEIILTNDGSVGDKQFSFAPKALCPDEKEIELPKTDIEVDGHDDFEVAQSAADNNGDGAWAPGEAVTIQTLVKNNTAMDFTDDDLELTLTTPSQVVNQRFEMQGGQCVPQANSGVCRFALRFGQQITVTTRFNLPNNIDQNSNTFSVGAKLEVKAKGETVPFEASPVVITVPVGNQ